MNQDPVSRVMTDMTDRTSLYLVYLIDPEQSVEAADGNIFQLSENHFLVRSEQTQSRLYHAIKRRTRPRGLLVAPLAADPKFKGMAEGALKWVRSG